MVYLPVGVDMEVEIVIVLVKDGVPELGLKLYGAPEGKPEAERVTDWVEPETSPTLTAADTLPPCCTLPLWGLTDIEKSKG